ncbi:MAG: hypothetical protein MI799_22935 [Desulfobacterales bacterium]|nr:hypothetical protein [Desulfobacterales bacterium]
MLPKYQTITFIFFSTIFLVFCSKSIATENKSAIDEGKNYFFENNLNKSFDILYPIAKKNDEEAQFYIGAILQKRKDYKVALEWFKKSGKNNYSQAYYQIGLMYDNGQGG